MRMLRYISCFTFCTRHKTNLWHGLAVEALPGEFKETILALKSGSRSFQTSVTQSDPEDGSFQYIMGDWHWKIGCQFSACCCCWWLLMQRLQLRLKYPLLATGTDPSAAGDNFHWLLLWLSTSYCICPLNTSDGVVLNVEGQRTPLMVNYCFKDSWHRPW